MQPTSITPRATYRNWRGRVLNRLCLRWPSIPRHGALRPYETAQSRAFVSFEGSQGAAEFLVLSFSERSSRRVLPGAFCRTAQSAVEWGMSPVPPVRLPIWSSLRSAEQFFEVVKISAQEPALRCSRVFPILQDIEDRAIHDGQI